MSQESSKITLCPFGVVGAPHKLDAVDASLREPVFMLILASVKWLLVAGVLGFIVSVQALVPDFFASCAYINFGRLEPILRTAVVYGFGFNAGLALALFLTVRLARVKICALWVVFVAAIFWNVGVIVGVIGILFGHQVPMPLLEMPRESAPLLMFSYALMGVWGMVAFMKRERKVAYISQALVVAALFWFPWIYIVAQSMVVMDPVTGVVQNIVAGWYASGVMNLWLAPIALAAAFYVIPRVLGVQVKYYFLLHGAFWLYAFIACWACGRYLYGAPIPAWTQTVSSVASVALVLPVIIFLVSLFSTALSNLEVATNSPSVRFMMTGLGFYGLSILGHAVLMVGGELLQFTYYVKALDVLGLYGGVAMIFCGAIYFVLPGLLEREWLSTTLLKAHYWGMTAGVLLAALGMVVAGIIQGVTMNDAEITYAQTADLVQPWLQLNGYGFLLILIGVLGFALNFHRLLFPAPQQREQVGATCFEATE